MPEPAPSRSGNSAFESDFRDLRDARGMSLEDLHNETRVPVDVLRRFESGQLLADPSFSDVYLRAFVKGYAKAIGLPQARAVEAFDAHRAGRYSGQLRPDYTPPKAQAPPPPTTPEASGGDTSPPPSAAPEAKGSGAPGGAPPPGRSAEAPAVEALRTGGTAVPASQTQSETEAPRLRRPVVSDAKRSFDKNWGTLGAIAVLLLAVCCAAVWFLVFRDGGGDDTDLTAASGPTTEAALPDTTGAAATGPTGPRLQTPIALTVEATDGGLQWFRVTEDSGDRTPYWIDEGTSQTFTADSTLVVWGEGNEGGPALDYGQATLELQGLRWRPADGAPVRVSLQNGQALLDSLAAAGVSATSTAPEASGAQPQ